MRNPFRYFNSSPEVIRLAVMMYIRYPLSLRQVEDLLFERGIDICHETVRYWWNRFGPMFAAAIRKRRIHHRSFSQWRWHLDEVFVRINGETHYLWRAVDHEGEVLEVFATKRRDRRAALKFLKRTMKRYGRPRSIVTDRLRSYRSAMKAIGNAAAHECGRWLNNRAENSHQTHRRRVVGRASRRRILGPGPPRLGIPSAAACSITFCKSAGRPVQPSCRAPPKRKRSITCSMMVNALSARLLAARRASGAAYNLGAARRASVGASRPKRS